MPQPGGDPGPRSGLREPPAADAAGFPGAGGAGGPRGLAAGEEGPGGRREREGGGRGEGEGTLNAPDPGLRGQAGGRNGGRGEGPCVPTSRAWRPVADTCRPLLRPHAPHPARTRGGDPGLPSWAPRPRGRAPPPPSPSGPAFQSRQIVTLEKELRQGQVCFSLEVSKESNLLLRSAADVSGACAPRAGCGDRGGGAGGRRRRVQEPGPPRSRPSGACLPGRVSRINQIFRGQRSASPSLCREHEMREYACYLSHTHDFNRPISHATRHTTADRAPCTLYWF